jgi:hypothetical protein
MSADVPTELQTVAAVETCSLTNTTILVLLEVAFLYNHVAINSGRCCELQCSHEEKDGLLIHLTS